MTFTEHKESTAADCEAVAEILKSLAEEIRAGDLKAFERFWIEGGTEDGDGKIVAIRQQLALRYFVRKEKAAQ